jgi:DNA-binding transcriptional MerR regulator
MTSTAASIEIQQSERPTRQAIDGLESPEFLFIGELSRETGADPKTIRFYEREGLLSPPRHGRFRTYLSADVKRLKDILIMRRMGIGIAQIRSLLAIEGGFNVDGGGATTNLLLNHMEMLRQKQAELTRQMEATTAVLQRCTAGT